MHESVRESPSNTIFLILGGPEFLPPPGAVNWNRPNGSPVTRTAAAAVGPVSSSTTTHVRARCALKTVSTL